MQNHEQLTVQGTFLHRPHRKVVSTYPKEYPYLLLVPSLLCRMFSSRPSPLEPTPGPRGLTQACGAAAASLPSPLHVSLVGKPAWGTSSHLVQLIAKELFSFYYFEVNNHISNASGNSQITWGSQVEIFWGL